MNPGSCHLSLSPLSNMYLFSSLSFFPKKLFYPASHLLWYVKILGEQENPRYFSEWAMTTVPVVVKKSWFLIFRESFRIFQYWRWKNRFFVVTSLFVRLHLSCFFIRFYCMGVLVFVSSLPYLSIRLLRFTHQYTLCCLSWSQLPPTPPFTSSIFSHRVL